MKRLPFYLSIVPMIMLTGCMGQYYPLKDMTAEQIRAAVSPKEAGLTCMTATYAGAKATTLFVNADKGVPAGITVDENCKTTFGAGSQPGGATIPVQLQVVPQK
jgi:hypothetical protein